MFKNIFDKLWENQDIVYNFKVQLQRTELERGVWWYIRHTPSSPCPKQTKQNCFCQNFVNFPPTFI